MKLVPLLLLACSFATAMFAANAEVAKVTPSDAFSRVSAGEAVLVDVREPSEWAESGVAAPAELLPMSDFDGDQKLRKPFLEKNAGKELILYCRSGNRSGKVAAKLEAKGHKVGNG